MEFQLIIFATGYFKKNCIYIVWSSSFMLIYRVFDWLVSSKRNTACQRIRYWTIKAISRLFTHKLNDGGYKTPPQHG